MNLALGTTLILCALASMPASAQDTDRLALQRAATGQGFTIGDTNFRLVPNARVLRNTTPPPAQMCLQCAVAPLPLPA